VPRLMMRWHVRLSCGHSVEVLTLGNNPTVAHEDDWWCRRCEAPTIVVVAEPGPWEVAPDLKLHGQS
jgi:hypothetical protein